ncbi:polymorphic toxin type 8 domain-containing protein, partial [Chitinophaga oryziterrae]
QTDTALYVATMETAASAVENALFSNIDNTRTAKPTGYPTDNTTNPNAYVAKLNASNGQKIGPSLVLRVMAGDSITIAVKALYKNAGASTPYTTSSSMVTSILQAFSGGGITDGVHSGTGGTAPVNMLTSGVYDGLKSKDSLQNLSGKPKAYLNFALFDDQFNLVDENSGVRQVQGPIDSLVALVLNKTPIKKTGFLYIYTSNESAQDVFFDNLIVTHNTGPLLEETHYYPFGLAMGGISNHALKGSLYPENRKKYNGIEFTDALDLDTYDAFYRTLDPQVPRWWQIDPKIDEMEMWSPYVSNYDNPIRYSDFLGDEPDGNGGPGKPILQGPVQALQQMVDEGPAIIDEAHAVGAAIVGGAIAISLSKPDWSQLGAPGSNGSIMFIPDQIMHPGAYEPTAAPAPAVGKINAPTATELPYPIAGRVNAPANTPAPPNYVFAKGREGKQQRLKELANDPNQSSANRGWLKNEMRHVENGNRQTLRLPGNSRNSKTRGYELAHPHGKRAKDGNSYQDAKLQTAELHKLEHKVHGY